MYMRSMDYDISHMEEGSSSSAVNKLDAIASKKVTRGPTMEITDDHTVVINNAGQDSAKMRLVEPNKPKNDTPVVDTQKKIQVKKTEPIGTDTTSLIVQTHTDKGNEFNISDKLPSSYQNGSDIYTFSKEGGGTSLISLEWYNDKGYGGSFLCEQQGVFIYVKGTQDVFSCTDGNVHLGNRNTNSDVQLYQVKVK